MNIYSFIVKLLVIIQLSNTWSIQSFILGVRQARALTLGPGQPLLAMSLEPWAMSQELWAVNHQAGIKHQVSSMISWSKPCVFSSCLQPFFTSQNWIGFRFEDWPTFLFWVKRGIYIYIYIKRERERERGRFFFIQIMRSTNNSKRLSGY